VANTISGLLIFCLVLLPAAMPAAANGVSDTSIVFGQSACFSGPNRQLGFNYRAGIRAALREANSRGGVNGRILRLISLDDAYEPELAAANAERFATENDVFAVIGGVGTPTAKRIAPVLKSAKIPFVGPFTGASFLRNARRFPNVVNLRAGYLDETRVLVNHILRKRGKKRFGIIYQDDAFGRSVLKNYKSVLDGIGIPILGKTAFSRNTHAVQASLFALAKADLEAIMIVGAYASNSEIINLAHSLGHRYIMANLSFVLSYELKKRIDAPNDRILVSEVMPNARETNMRVVRSFHRALAAAEDGLQAGNGSYGINEVSLEGYILGRFVIEVLARMGDELTRENFLEQALTSGPVAIDDWELAFEPGTNSGSRYVRLIDLGGD
jgi:ABC-type branched-subunit amino acid transport system substrate-binding protein